MKNIFKSLILLLIFTSLTAIAQDTNIIKYFPLRLGNIWIYHYTYTPYYNTNVFLKKKIDSTINLQGHVFYRFIVTCRYVSGYPPCGDPYYEYYRVDSVTGRVFQYISGTGCFNQNYNLFDSLLTPLNDSEGLCRPRYAYCVDTSSKTVLNVIKSTKNFEASGFEFYYLQRYAKGIGLYYMKYCGLSCGESILTGCVIDGTVYGDTLFITDIINTKNILPESYSLSQNYPNPFNPETKILFSIPKPGLTRLAVYNVLGEEILKLVDEFKPAGEYEIKFNGEKYSSGVYFYKLTSGDFSETKKMVLIK